ncbi:hypothetical protein AGMMS50268_13180 [Spirochaetia bacterium]|nr:hypothetical protein AGMMS50268_13180 [Spirochaetia bacterium]
MTSEERRQGRYERRKAKREAKRREKIGDRDSFDLITDLDNLNAAFKKAQKTVHWKESVQRYEMNRIGNLIEARRKLLAGENVQQGFIQFTLNERGKTRNIKGIQIAERVVQKCLCDQVLVPILSRQLIHDNGASLKDKGVQFAVKRLITHLSRYYRQNGTNEGYALLIDFSKFYDNVDHEALFKMLDEQIKDKRVKELTFRFISVFGEGKSLGMGSQVSQIAAIFFPNLIDHIVKDGPLRIKFYGRYMDDIYLIHRDKKHLEFCLREIEKACATLKITVNMKKTRIVKLRYGILFLKGKYALTETGKVLRLPCRDSTIRQTRKLKKFKTLLEAGKMTFKDIRNAYQSWRGAFKKRFQVYYKIQKIDRLYDELFIK